MSEIVYSLDAEKEAGHMDISTSRIFISQTVTTGKRKRVGYEQIEDLDSSFTVIDD